MHVRVPVQEFAERLDGGDHAGNHVLPAEQAADFGLEARPGAGSKLAQQLAVEAGVQPETFGDGQHDLPVRDGSTHVFGHVDLVRFVICQLQGTANNGPMKRHEQRWWQSGQRTRAKPSCRSPHLRKAFTLCSTTGRQKPYLAANRSS